MATTGTTSGLVEAFAVPLPECLDLEDGTDRLFPGFGNQLPAYLRNNPEEYRPQLYLNLLS
jgi:hypothetical protein